MTLRIQNKNFNISKTKQKKNCQGPRTKFGNLLRTLNIFMPKTTKLKFLL